MAKQPRWVLTESQFLKRPTERFREKEIDKDNLVGEPGAIRDEVLPADVLDADGVNVCGEETSQSPKELEHGDTTGALRVGPHFDHVGWQLQVSTETV